MKSYKWKVVKAHDRSSCSFDPSEKDKKYFKIYKKGTTVKAPKNSFGIFCFKRKKDAEKFKEHMAINSTLLYGTQYIILKVEPIGKGKTPKEIIYRGLMSDFYNNTKIFVVREEIAPYHSGVYTENFIKTTLIPPGTICYPAVKVLS